MLNFIRTLLCARAVRYYFGSRVAWSRAWARACMRRRDFINLIAGSAAAWPLVARAQQQPLVPVVGLVNPRSPDTSARHSAAFRNGLGESGYVEGQNIMVEYHWLNGRYDHLPLVIGDLVRRRVAVIATPGSTPAALKAE